jgi:hypothetical protein
MHGGAAHATDTSVGALFVTPRIPCERPHCREPPASRQAGCQSYDCHRGSIRCRMRPKMHAGVECQAENSGAPMQEGTSDRRVYVCDRENSRIQVFSSDGRYLSMWRDIQRPTAISVDAVTLHARGSAVCLLDDLCSVAIWRSCCGKNQRSGAPLLRPAHTSHGRPPEKWRTQSARRSF